jgi:hypothetical protein
LFARTYAKKGGRPEGTTWSNGSGQRSQNTSQLIRNKGAAGRFVALGQTGPIFTIFWRRHSRGVDGNY